MDFLARQKKLSRALHALGHDGMIITHLPNVRYLCGFTGSNALLLAFRGKYYFYTDGRYTQQARQEVSGARIAIVSGVLAQGVAQRLERVRQAHLGFESDRLSFTAHAGVHRVLPRGIRLAPVSGLVESLRLVKDRVELNRIQDAVVLGAELLTPAYEAIRPGVRESEVAAEIEYAARRWGAEQMSFETIVAAGKRSALPHGRASNHRIPTSGFVILDLGVILAGYCSDMTRTVYVGTAKRTDRDIYHAVLEAQLAAIDAARPGVTAGSVDEAARTVLRKAGLDHFFVHSTGHGVGLEIHEAPRIGKGQSEILEPGMVITVEPGVYLPGTGGVRIEDMVVITARGCRVLTPAAKEFLEL